MPLFGLWLVFQGVQGPGIVTSGTERDLAALARQDDCVDGLDDAIVSSLGELPRRHLPDTLSEQLHDIRAAPQRLAT